MRYSLLLISSLATLNFFTSAVPFVHQGLEVANQGLSGAQSPVAIRKRGDDDDDDDWDDDWDHDEWKDDDEDCEDDDDDDDDDDDHKDWDKDYKHWDKDSVWDKDYKDWDNDYGYDDGYKHDGYDHRLVHKKGRKTKTVYFIYTITTTSTMTASPDPGDRREHDGRHDEWPNEHGRDREENHWFGHRLDAEIPSPTMASIAATRTPLANPVVATTDNNIV